MPFGHLPFGTLAMRQLPFGTLAIRESCHSTYLPFGTLAIRDTCHSGQLPFEDTCHSDTCHSKTLAIQKLAIQDTCHSGYLPFKTLAIWARKFKLAVKRQFFICFRTDYDKDWATITNYLSKGVLPENLRWGRTLWSTSSRWSQVRFTIPSLFAYFLDHCTMFYWTLLFRHFLLIFWTLVLRILELYHSVTFCSFVGL